MSDQKLKSLPKGLLKTVAYTQLCEAIKKDFGIELPERSGVETTRVIEEMLGVRLPDPIEEALASALDSILLITNDSEGVAGYHLNGNVACWDEFPEIYNAIEVLQKYQQSKAKP